MLEEKDFCKDEETLEQEEVEEEGTEQSEEVTKCPSEEQEEQTDCEQVECEDDTEEDTDDTVCQDEVTFESDDEDAQAELAVSASSEDEMDDIPSMEDTEALDFEPLQPGDVLQGTIVQVNDDNVLVDVRYKSDGVIPLSELRLKSGERPQDVFSEGQEIPVYILSVDGQDGAVLASYRRALDEIAWDRLYQAHEDKEILEVPVVEEVKGGLVLDVYGLRGFMPASHVDRGFVSDLSVYVGETVRTRVVELDRNKNRIIISRKVVLEEEHAGQREETWAKIEEGQTVSGVVKGLTDFGAFIDLGGVDGLLHVSQMSWGRVDHPSDVLEVGEEIDVKVLRVDREAEKISLGLKQLLPDPWESIDERYNVDDVVQGKIMRIAPFGAFVQLEPGVEGLVHISELADYHVTEPSEVVSEGEDVMVKVLRVQPKERRISLSLKEARKEEEQQKQPRPQRRVSGNLTLGDVFGDLLTETRDRLADDLAESEEAAEADDTSSDEDSAEAPSEDETEEAEDDEEEKKEV